MTEETKDSVFLKIDLNPKVNNAAHHTSEISESQLVVRRGQSFRLILTLSQPFNSHPLHFTAITGSYPSEKQGTASFFGLPGDVKRSALAKAVWKVELDNALSPRTGVLTLNFTPPADAPIGEYMLSVKHRGEEKLLAMLTVLFNPWCKDDWVFIPDKDERQEYVMNEQGIIYRGSGNYISPMNWNFGQFEESMVNICLRILDLNHKHLKDPADDVSARCNPIYVSRVISAMINCEDDCGVLEGRWAGPYWGGVSPSHWSGSHPILMQWIRRDCHPVKYGQCWVFAGVMCSVMRLLGIPCRVVTNYSSAHDNNRNLTIDVYHADYGVREKETHDSVWNFHVWVEGWMRRPDLAEDGKYDGWQVLDPTPQEKSGGVYCCGPAPVKAIFEGQTDLKYDIPFVFAEVNADCIDWLVKADGSLVNISSDTKRVGQNISTKSVGSNKRLNITDNYKHREGSEEERAVFKYACTRDYSRVDKNEDIGDGNVGPGETVGNVGPGETDGNVGPGESVGNVGPGETVGNVGPGESVGNVRTGESVRNVGTAETVGNVRTGESVGNVRTGETVGNVRTGESVGNVRTGESVGNVGTAETVGNVRTGESVGNVRTGESVGNVGTAETVGNVRTGESVGNVGTAETVGNVRTGESVGNVGTGESVGNVGTAETVGNVRTGESVGNVGTAETVGNVRTGESVGNVGTGVSETTSETIPPPPQVFLRFEEVSKPTNGKDVELKLVLHSDSTVTQPLSINISAQAMTYNGIPAVNIQSEMKEEKLEPKKDLSIPIVVPFSSYHKHMVDCDSMKISAIVTDIENAKTYLAVSDVVLLHPPISVSVLTKDIRAFREVTGQVVFMNPAKETLKNCKLTLSGNGLWKEENVHPLPDMKQNNRITVTFYFIPYKTGEKTLVVNFDCATFRNIKCSCTVNVRP